MIYVAAVYEEVVCEDCCFGIGLGVVSYDYVVVYEGWAVVHFEEQGSRLGIVDDVAGDADSLVAEVDPDTEGALLLMVDAADQVGAYYSIDAVVELNGCGFPAAEFFFVVCVFDEVSDDEGAGCAFLSGDSGLAAAADEVIADDVVAVGIDVGVVYAGCVAEDYSYAS